MRIIMMGTGPFAVPTFRALMRRGHQIPVLVTRPARVGVGAKSPPVNPMRVEAESASIEVWDPEDVNDPEVVDRIRQLGADLLVVCDYGQILSPDLIRSTRLGGINLHGSLLPKYRGAAPVNWAIYRGESETGVSVIHLTPGLDAGPIVSRRVTPIGAEEDAVSVERRLADLGVDAVLEAVELLDHWTGEGSIGQPQDPDHVTRARRLRKSDGRIDWHRPARRIVDQLRAFKPWPGCYTYWMRPGKPPERWIIDRARVVAPPVIEPHPPGTIIVDRDRLMVACGKGWLEVIGVQPAGKRLMEVGELLRGYRVETGGRLATDEHG